MPKIRRNQSCPCGSGKKHKHCCLLLQQAARAPFPVRQSKISLTGEIAKLQQAAADFKVRVYELGVFIFFSMENGDAWVLEATDSDALPVAAGGKALPFSVTEDGERIVVDWSHNFTLLDKKLFMTEYTNGRETELDVAPTRRINAAMRRILKQYPAELLDNVHLRDEENAVSA